MGDVKSVYIAGPMRGIPEFNFPAFMEAADTCRRAGLKVYNPAQEDIDLRGFTAEGLTGNEDLSALGFDLTEALTHDLSIIAHKADAVVVLDGWEKSKGAQAEVALARALGKPVFDILGAPIDETPTGEVRTTSSTGGQKGDKPARFDLIPVEGLWPLAELYGAGARKYEDRNWERGYPWHLSFAAMQRHAWQWWNGEDTDAETGASHLASVAWHAFALLFFTVHFPDFDDRPTTLKAGGEES